MLRGYTLDQKIMEISSAAGLLTWLISVLLMWNKKIVIKEDKSSMIFSLVTCLIIYSILTFFTYAPDATKIVSTKNNTTSNRPQIIRISRSLFLSVKIISVAAFASLAMSKVFNHELISILTYIILLAYTLSMLLYWIFFNRIPN